VNCGKPLIGSGCRLGGEWGRSKDECIDGGGDRRIRGKGSFGRKCEACIVVMRTSWRRYPSLL